MTELKPAMGEGEAHFDERALFFLQHRKQIDSCYGLRYDATQAISSFLEDLAEPLAEVVPEWPPWAGTIGGYRCLFLVPPQVDTSDFPWTGVALGWKSNGVMPEVNRSAPWVGLYVFPQHERSGVMRAALDTADDGKNDYASSEPWPRYRFVPAAESWWTDLDSYRSLLIDEYRALLSRYRGVVESVA
jgi:hypothetical protein